MFVSQLLRVRGPGVTELSTSTSEVFRKQGWNGDHLKAQSVRVILQLWVDCCHLSNCVHLSTGWQVTCFSQNNGMGLPQDRSHSHFVTYSQT